MRLLILEDEAPTARQIRAYAARYGLPTHDVHEVRSVARALDWFAQHPMPNLIFSDIELLDGNVFGLYEQVAVSCPIIFITAYDQFWQAAFQASGISYLLKPFTYAQFAASVGKYERLQASLTAGSAWPAEALTHLQTMLRPAPSYRQRLTVRQPNNGFYLLPVAEVAYLEAEEGLIFAHDRQGARHPLPGTLTEWEQQLDPTQFFRLNRGELVQLAAITRVEPYFNNRLAVQLAGGATLISAAAQTAAFRRWLDN